MLARQLQTGILTRLEAALEQPHKLLLDIEAAAHQLAPLLCGPDTDERIAHAAANLPRSPRQLGARCLQLRACFGRALIALAGRFDEKVDDGSDGPSRALAQARSECQIFEAQRGIRHLA